MQLFSDHVRCKANVSIVILSHCFHSSLTNLTASVPQRLSKAMFSHQIQCVCRTNWHGEH